MTIRLLVFALFVVTASHVQSQSFDVASIRPNPDSTDRAMHRSPGRLTATASVRALISVASDLPEQQIVGGPDWVGSTRYDIIATATPSPDQMFVSHDDKLRILRLLSERFQLTMHTEKREYPIYALVISKNGIKLLPPTLASARPGLTGGTGRSEGHLAAVNVPLSMLTAFLSQELGRPVKDQTGLTGRYDFKMNWLRGEDGPAQQEYPTIYTAVREQLGLRLVSKTGPVDFIVIDHVERPSEN